MQLLPHLVVNDGHKALEYYKAAFGAEVLELHTTPDGAKVFHSVVKLGDSTFMLCDEFNEADMGCNKAPHTLGGTPIMLTLLVEDADGVQERCVLAGAEVVMPVAEQFWGGRYGQVLDPFGHVWAFNQPVRQVSEAEIKQATKEIFA